MKTLVKSLVPAPVRASVGSLYDDLHRRSAYLGNVVHCPICEGHFRFFLPYGVFPQARPGAQCPKCGSLERHRLMWLYFLNCTNLFREKLSVLHFAPEPALEKRLSASPNLDYTTTDLYQPAMVKADITDLPFSDCRFDVILCSHVLEHVPDDRKAMRELYRVLKPGGWALLLVPIEMGRAITFEDPTITDPHERFRLFHQEDHVRIYGRDYLDRLREAGFTVRQEAYIDELDPALVKRCGLEAKTGENSLFVGFRL